MATLICLSVILPASTTPVQTTPLLVLTPVIATPAEALIAFTVFSLVIAQLGEQVMNSSDQVQVLATLAAVIITFLASKLDIATLMVVVTPLLVIKQVIVMEQVAISLLVLRLDSIVKPEPEILP